jgi:hypothetical protein
MALEKPLTRQRLTTPRAAAVAGIIFGLLLGTSLLLIRITIPPNSTDTGEWITRSRGVVLIALNMVPFAGIAFLWFMGVVRDRLGAMEDRFFATVFLGSGLLFLAMLFASAAVAGGLIFTLDSPRELAAYAGVLQFARAVTYQILNIYAIKMAGVFMISLCTIAMRTGIMPRWMIYLGYALALLLLLTIGLVSWISLVFPMWILLLSVYLLIENYRRGGDTDLPISPRAVPLSQQDN